MANIKSQIKRNRQTVVRQERNKALRSELKTRNKAVFTAVEAGDVEKANEALKIAQKRIDMAVTKGLLTKNTAGRRKARLMKRVATLTAG